MAAAPVPPTWAGGRAPTSLPGAGRSGWRHRRGRCRRRPLGARDRRPRSGRERLGDRRREVGDHHRRRFRQRRTAPGRPHLDELQQRIGVQQQVVGVERHVDDEAERVAAGDPGDHGGHRATAARRLPVEAAHPGLAEAADPDRAFAERPAVAEERRPVEHLLGPLPQSPAIRQGLELGPGQGRRRRHLELFPDRPAREHRPDEAGVVRSRQGGQRQRDAPEDLAAVGPAPADHQQPGVVADGGRQAEAVHPRVDGRGREQVQDGVVPARGRPARAPRPPGEVGEELAVHHAQPAQQVDPGRGVRERGERQVRRGDGQRALVEEGHVRSGRVAAGSGGVQQRRDRPLRRACRPEPCGPGDQPGQSGVEGRIDDRSEVVADGHHGGERFGRQRRHRLPGHRPRGELVGPGGLRREGAGSDHARQANSRGGRPGPCGARSGPGGPAGRVRRRARRPASRRSAPGAARS